MKATLTCPDCEHEQIEEIPKISCQNSYKCNNCGKIISAKKSCCVFCDYGDEKCPISHKN